MSWYRQNLEIWLHGLEVQVGTVVDWGGFQNPVKDRVKSWKVKDYRIWDIPEYDLNKNLSVGADIADIIFCLEVFEYIFNPYQAFQNIQRVLKPDGRAFISFPFVYPVHQEIELDSLRYTETGIRRLASASDLNIEWIKPRKARSQDSFWLYKFFQADGMRMAKGMEHDTTGYICEFSK